jgi:membrane-anchored glycerophosphoryl diester phosphodiesterase (GDPDase)
VMLVISIALFVCLNVPRLLATHLGGVARLGITGVALILGLLVQAFFLYAIPLVVLERYSAPKAIAASVRITRRSAFTTFLLVAVPFILTVPTLLLGFRAELLAFRISPDFLLINQIAGEIMQLIATYLIVGGATIALIHRLQTDAGTMRKNKSREAVYESVDRTGRDRPIRTGV